MHNLVSLRLRSVPHLPPAGIPEFGAAQLYRCKCHLACPLSRSPAGGNKFAGHHGFAIMTNVACKELKMRLLEG